MRQRPPKVKAAMKKMPTGRPVADIVSTVAAVVLAAPRNTVRRSTAVAPVSASTLKVPPRRRKMVFCQMVALRNPRRETQPKSPQREEAMMW